MIEAAPVLGWLADAAGRCFARPGFSLVRGNIVGIDAGSVYADQLAVAHPRNAGQWCGRGADGMRGNSPRRAASAGQAGNTGRCGRRDLRSAGKFDRNFVLQLL